VPASSSPSVLKVTGNTAAGCAAFANRSWAAERFAMAALWRVRSWPSRVASEHTAMPDRRWIISGSISTKGAADSSTMVWRRVESSKPTITALTPIGSSQAARQASGPSTHHVGREALAMRVGASGQTAIFSRPVNGLCCELCCDVVVGLLASYDASHRGGAGSVCHLSHVPPAYSGISMACPRSIHAAAASAYPAYRGSFTVLSSFISGAVPKCTRIWSILGLNWY